MLLFHDVIEMTDKDSFMEMFINLMSFVHKISKWPNANDVYDLFFGTDSFECFVQ